MDAGLLALTERIKGMEEERKAWLARAEQARADISILERAVAILQGVPVAAPPARKTRTTHDVVEGVDRSTYRKALLEALREAGQPMTTAQCVDATLARLGKGPDTPRTGLSTTTNHILTKYIKPGVVRQSRNAANNATWEVTR